MTNHEKCLEYLKLKLQESDFDLIRQKRISIIQVGSSADERADQNSDWDFKIFAESQELEAFERVHGNKFSFSDNTHIPNAFILVRGFDSLRGEFKRYPIDSLWVYERAKIIRDDGGCFGNQLSTLRAGFEEGLSQLIEDKYLELRTRRHGIDSMVKRNDVLSAMMLSQECIKICLQLLHLIHGGAAPYPTWLIRVSKDSYAKQFPDFFACIERFGYARDGDVIKFESRQLVAHLINIMVAKGYDRTRLEKWWEHI